MLLLHLNCGMCVKYFSREWLGSHLKLPVKTRSCDSDVLIGH